MSLPFPVPLSLPPSLLISHCTTEDINTLTEVYYDAFRTDPRNAFWWPADKKAMIAWMSRRIRRKMSDRHVRHFKVTDRQSGDLVAFARWDVPEGHEEAFGDWIGDDGAAATTVVNAPPAAATGENSETAEQGVDLPVTSGRVEVPTPPAFDYPEGARPELCLRFFNALGAMSEKQNAKAMLADAEGLKVYLEATPHGKPVYEKLGFREVDQLTFDLKELINKDDGVYKISIMVREPMSTL
ncbi:hypothetical protein AAE478_007168 [Parahypoxylon ruwenzoriense]